jgi:hypothetical protein
MRTASRSHPVLSRDLGRWLPKELSCHAVLWKFGLADYFKSFLVLGKPCPKSSVTYIVFPLRTTANPATL